MGLFLLNLMGEITTDGLVVAAMEDVTDCVGNELTDDGEMDEDPRTDDPELNLLA